MSNGFKDNERDKNQDLIYKYPWLMPIGVDKDNYDYEFTFLDGMPFGWRIAFGESMCEEIKNILDEYKANNDYHIVQIKEKFGQLRWYADIDIKDDVVWSLVNLELNKIYDKYEALSEKTCIECGDPATKKSIGYIAPFCDECAKQIHDEMRDI